MVAIPTHTELVLHLGQAHYRLPLQATVILDAHTTVLLGTLLGGDQDDTCAGTATVQGGSGSTLQNGHALNVVGVNGAGTVTEVVTAVQTITAVGCRVVQGHTIHNIQRLVATRERAHTTNDNRFGSTGVGRCLSNLDTSHLTGKARHDVVGACLCDDITLNGSGRHTQRLCFALNTHRRNNHLIKSSVVLLKGDCYITRNRNDL